MAITETYASDMTASDLVDETKQLFYFFSEEYAVEHGVVADQNNVSLEERCFVSTTFRTEENPVGAVNSCVAPYTQLTPANFPGLDVPSLMSALVLIFNKQRLNCDLVRSV